jgi:hypothetical protein
VPQCADLSERRAAEELPSFQFSLKPGGLLFLALETIGGSLITSRSSTRNGRSFAERKRPWP